MRYSTPDTVRHARVSLTAAGILAIAASAACAPVATVTHAAATKTTRAQTASGGSVMPIYTSPMQTRDATTHDVTAPALTAYPWANDETGGSDSYGMTMRQCVSYAAWYINAHGTPFGHFTRGPNGVGTFGDAGTWDMAALAAGFTVSTHPVVGSIAQWHDNESSTTTTATGWSTITAGPQGHVAVVTRVYPNGAVDLAQYNFGFSRAFSIQTDVMAPRYIYIPMSSPWVP